MPRRMIDRIFTGFGVVTVISGIYLIFEKDYLIGISGSIVGIGLILSTSKYIKKKEKEEADKE